jgi:hypothetical protein
MNKWWAINLWHWPMVSTKIFHSLRPVLRPRKNACQAHRAVATHTPHTCNELPKFLRSHGLLFELYRISYLHRGLTFMKKRKGSVTHRRWFQEIYYMLLTAKYNFWNQRILKSITVTKAYLCVFNLDLLLHVTTKFCTVVSKWSFVSLGWIYTWTVAQSKEHEI